MVIKGFVLFFLILLSVRGVFAQGVQPRELLLGGYLPLTGPLQNIGDVAKGADAYFQYINDQGGVHGRLIRYQYVDDHFNPELAKYHVQDMVLNQEVLALFASVGNRSYMDLTKWSSQMEIPNLFLISREVNMQGMPHASSFMPSLKVESSILSRYLATQYPRQKVVIWSRQDGYHQKLSRAVAQDLKKYQVSVQVLKHEKFLQSLHEEALKIQKSQADILVVFSTPDASSRLISRLKQQKPEQIYLGYDAKFAKSLVVKSDKKILTLSNFPFASHLENKGIRLHHRLLKAYFPELSPNQWTIYGHAAAESMVVLLQQIGRKLDRQTLLKHAYTFQYKQSHIVPPIHAMDSLQWVKSMRVAQFFDGSVTFVSPWIQAL